MTNKVLHKAAGEQQEEAGTILLKAQTFGQTARPKKGMQFRTDAERQKPKATPNNNPFHEIDTAVDFLKPKQEVIDEQIMQALKR